MSLFSSFLRTFIVNFSWRVELHGENSSLTSVWPWFFSPKVRLSDGWIWVSHTRVRSAQSLQTPLHLSVFFSPSSLCLFIRGFSSHLFHSECGRLFLFLVSGFLFTLRLLVFFLNNLLTYFSELSDFTVGIPSARLNISLILDPKSFSRHPSSDRRHKENLHKS